MTPVRPVLGPPHNAAPSGFVLLQNVVNPEQTAQKAPPTGFGESEATNRIWTATSNVLPTEAVPNLGYTWEILNFQLPVVHKFFSPEVAKHPLKLRTVVSLFVGSLEVVKVPGPFTEVELVGEKNMWVNDLVTFSPPVLLQVLEGQQLGYKLRGEIVSPAVSFQISEYKLFPANFAKKKKKVPGGRIVEPGIVNYRFI